MQQNDSKYYLNNKNNSDLFAIKLLNKKSKQEII